MADRAAGRTCEPSGFSRWAGARIFDPFFTTKQTEGGTGLGLYVCRSIVTQAGGEITVDSQPGHGTTFQLTLPTTRAARAGGATGAHALHDSSV